MEIDERLIIEFIEVSDGLCCHFGPQDKIANPSGVESDVVGKVRCTIKKQVWKHRWYRDTGFGKINDSPATSTVIYFADTSLSVISASVKCVVTHRGRRLRH